MMEDGQTEERLELLELKIIVDKNRECVIILLLERQIKKRRFETMTKTNETKMKLTVLNINGDMHVHKAGCADIKRTLKKNFFNEGWEFPIFASTQMEVVEEIWGCHIEEHLEDEGDYYSQFIHATRFAPCVHLPEGTRKY